MEQPTEPTLKIILPRLTDGELVGLCAFCKSKIRQKKFETPARWLLSVLHDETKRRANPRREPGSFGLPGWTHSEISEALLFVYVLNRHALTLGALEFVEELFQHVIGDCASRLALIGELQNV